MNMDKTKIVVISWEPRKNVLKQINGFWRGC